MEAFHFLRPLWFVVWPLLVLLVVLHLRAGRSGGVWQSVVDKELLPFLVSGENQISRRRGIGLLLAGTLAITALAGPTWEQVPVPVFRQESALVIALDLSSSMNAADLTPSRLAHARFRIADLLAMRRDGQTALIVFAAQSFVVTPLTSDTATLVAHLQGLETAIMPSQGSAPRRAIEQAGALLEQAGIHRGHVLLVTDGADSRALGAARAAADQLGLDVSVLGVGTEDGAPIPDASGGFIKDATTGKIVLSLLDRPALETFSAACRGLYVDSRGGDEVLARLQTHIDDRLGAATERLDELATSQWREFGPWLLLPLLPLAALGFRRGVLAVFALCAVLPVTPARAADSWWRTPDQNAARAFESGSFEEAKMRFENPAWRAAASYRAGDYEAAAKALEGLEGPAAHYNRGNALARAGQYQEALSAYETALERNPDNSDAAHNKAIVEALLESLEPPPQQGGENESQDEQSGEQQRDEQSEGQGSGDSGDQQNAETGAEDGASSAEQESEENEPSEGGESESAANEEPDEAQADAEQAPGSEGAETAAAQAAAESEAEQAQATEQWLRQIPDDPSGLLRRKFHYQYKQRYGKSDYDGDRW